MLLIGCATRLPAAEAVQIIQFDLEGAGGTLFVTPDKRAILIDAGWPAGVGVPASPPDTAPVTRDLSGSATRIAAELTRRGITRLDYLIVTHYHVDHVGGLADLLKLVSVGAVVDHGANREPLAPTLTDTQRANAAATLYASYLVTVAHRKRVVVRPGDRLRVGKLTVAITNADGATLRRALPGAGEAGTGCPSASTSHGGGEENARSIGLVAQYGQARIVLLGDTTRDVEGRLVCPLDLIGRADLVIATHHGSAQSNDPALYATLRPRVVVMPNGATKGGDAAAFDAIAAAPGLQGLWQVHEATKTGARNTAPDHIANLAREPDMANPLIMAVATDGTVRVTNPRTGSSESYPRPEKASSGAAPALRQGRAE